MSYSNLPDLQHHVVGSIPPPRLPQKAMRRACVDTEGLCPPFLPQRRPALAWGTYIFLSFFIVLRWCRSEDLTDGVVA